MKRYKMYNKDEIKNNLTLDDIYNILQFFKANPQIKNDNLIISETICHNHPDEGSAKLYYYANTHLFKCFTDCGSTFDIYDLARKVKTIETGENWQLPQAVKFVVDFFNLELEEDNFLSRELNKDWELFDKIDKLKSEKEIKQKIELKIYDEKIIKYFPKPRIIDWEKEGISKSVMDIFNICYNPINETIVIPHYDINGNLIGIRERTLIKENEVYGKYKPAYINGLMYNHTLGFNLYGLNKSKDNIKNMQMAFVFESEKSTLQYASFMGLENNLSCACCGSSFINYQFKLLYSLGVKEIVIGFDKQFQKTGDEEWKRWTKKLEDIHNKYGSLCQISFLFDTANLLDYKDSPTDKGRDIFLELFKRRIKL